MMCYFNQSNVAHVTPYHIYFEFLQCYIYKLISWYIYYLITQLLISLLFNITTHFNFYEYIITVRALVKSFEDYSLVETEK